MRLAIRWKPRLIVRRRYPRKVRAITEERICIRRSVTCTFLGGKRGVENCIVAKRSRKSRDEKQRFHGHRCLLKFLFSRCDEHTKKEETRTWKKEVYFRTAKSRLSELHCHAVTPPKFFGVPQVRPVPLVTVTRKWVSDDTMASFECVENNNDSRSNWQKRVASRRS